MSIVIGVRFKRGSKSYYFDPGKHDIGIGDGVIVETSRGIEYGVCSMERRDVPDPQIVQPLRPVVRAATAHDMETVASRREKERGALAVCQQKADTHGLEMRVVDCEHTFDGAKLLFFFTADGRVDFRELVKDLASEFHTRIELRQIGVRDEAKMLGGLGICGKPFCCATFLEEFRPVSIKMAKEQNLSLNPVKISGTCGRLMCCLTYEQAAYEDLQRTTPQVDSVVETPAGRGTVMDVNLLRGQVKVRLDSQPDAPPKLFDKCDLMFQHGACGGCRSGRRKPKNGGARHDDTHGGL
ncbi:MAG: stage 0 sporulation family protein [Oscillospiraceae bacterium]|nr:stage 0 sporulation family protein [Oscillospiraceae bacterium]